MLYNNILNKINKNKTNKTNKTNKLYLHIFTSRLFTMAIST